MWAAVRFAQATGLAGDRLRAPNPDGLSDGSAHVTTIGDTAVIVRVGSHPATPQANAANAANENLRG